MEFLRLLELVGDDPVFESALLLAGEISPAGVRLQLSRWVKAGKIVHKEDVQQGIENAPRTFLRLFRGENTGKQLLKLADPPIRS